MLPDVTQLTDSLTWTTILVVTIALLTVVLWYRRRLNLLPPGPWGVPILGYLPWLDPQAPHLTLTSLAQRYGGIYALQLGGVYTVVLTDHRLIRQAFARDEFSGRAPLYLTHGIMKGYGLICAEGELWKDQRKFVASCLKNFGMVKFGVKREKMETRINVGVKQVLEKLQTLGLKDESLDILPTLLHSVGNVVNSLVFGKVWDEDDETWQWLQHLQEEGTKMIGVAGPLNFLPFLRHLPRFRDTLRFLVEGQVKTHELYDVIIRDHPLEGCEDVLGAFLAEMKKRHETGDVGFYTDVQFLHLLADLFGAGVDTTLTTLRWFLLFMATNQNVQARVQEELDGRLGRRLPTLGDVEALPYTEAALAETQRIRSILPLGFPHGTLKDTTLAGYHLPRGTMVVPLQWAVHMDPVLWDNPETLNPDRFLSEDGRFTKPEFFIPFQTGQRMCVGEELARMILFLFGASIIQQFQVLPPEGVDVNLTGDVGITLTPKPHTLRLKQRY